MAKIDDLIRRIDQFTAAQDTEDAIQEEKLTYKLVTACVEALEKIPQNRNSRVIQLQIKTLIEIKKTLQFMLQNPAQAEHQVQHLDALENQLNKLGKK